jgi:hypothetical protein
VAGPSRNRFCLDRGSHRRWGHRKDSGIARARPGPRPIDGGVRGKPCRTQPPFMRNACFDDPSRCVNRTDSAACHIRHAEAWHLPAPADLHRFCEVLSSRSECVRGATWRRWPAIVRLTRSDILPPLPKLVRAAPDPRRTTPVAAVLGGWLEWRQARSSPKNGIALTAERYSKYNTIRGGSGKLPPLPEAARSVRNWCAPHDTDHPSIVGACCAASAIRTQPAGSR